MTVEEAKAALAELEDRALSMPEGEYLARVDELMAIVALDPAEREAFTVLWRVGQLARAARTPIADRSEVQLRLQRAYGAPVHQVLAGAELARRARTPQTSLFSPERPAR